MRFVDSVLSHRVEMIMLPAAVDVLLVLRELMTMSKFFEGKFVFSY